MRNTLFYVIVLLALSCKTNRQVLNGPAGFRYYAMDSLKSDSQLMGMYLPYKLRMDSLMSEELCEVKSAMVKSKPEGSLGQWMADECLFAGEAFAQHRVDVALLNQGGIRVPELAVGPLTLGEVFEVMPFDNEIVLLRVTGELLDQMGEFIIKRGGDPIAGAQLHREGGKIFWLKEGKRLESEKQYWVATTDYLYKGGDNFVLLEQTDSVIYTGILLRDALIKGAKARTGGLDYPSGERRIYLD